jgi:hypothetical protein
MHQTQACAILLKKRAVAGINLNPPVARIPHWQRQQRQGRFWRFRHKKQNAGPEARILNP